ncbi:CELR3-like protein [Mya arenaria]|uniref:CELR3-like protein n=1 Tax=Mya arenaria TaxID=6604 RepID=A0ABY7DFE9_MYAAR|nr:CELR3-like protein [Mya arenaria]
MLRNGKSQTIWMSLRVAAYDTDMPDFRSTAIVYITVLRNVNAPQFYPPIYRVIIDEQTDVGQYILSLNVSDPDGDHLSCMLVSEDGVPVTAVSSPYFHINEEACAVYVNRDLQTDPTDQQEYVLSVRATDNHPTVPQVAMTTVYVTVLRDIAAPRFTNLPTSINVDENRDVGSVVYTVTAVDDDLEGRIVYALVGEFPVQSYFNLNTSTGAVRLQYSLLSDSQQNTVYTLYMLSEKKYSFSKKKNENIAVFLIYKKARFIAYDSANPGQRAQSTLNIRVVRNENAPVYNPSVYRETIADTFTVGQPVVKLTASDADGDGIFYVNNGDSVDQEFFYLAPDGQILLRKTLIGEFRNEFTFTITALDNRPQMVQRSAEASVTINVQRDSGPPRFVNAPYSVSIPINQDVNTTIFTVSAVDDDLKLLVTVYDSGSPLLEVQTTVTITINRNLHSPIFQRQNYEATVYDYEPVGSAVVVVNATDADVTSPENLVMYDIVSTSSISVAPFAIHPISGLITISRELGSETLNNYRIFRIIYQLEHILSIWLTPFENTFDNMSHSKQCLIQQLIISAEDLSYPFRSASATVNIVVIRNNNSPSFSRTTVYDVTVNEDQSIFDSILVVTATDPDEGRNGNIRYSVVNVTVMDNVFGINPVTGEIYTRVSLQGVAEDIYTFEVMASDNGIVPRTAVIQVTIRITREGAPYFPDYEYEVTIPENTRVNTEIITLAAVNPGSSVRVTATRRNQPTSEAHAIVRIYVTRNSAPPSFQHGDLVYNLSEDQPLGVSFGEVIASDFYVVASDRGVPSLSSSVRVTVNVIRNRNAPVFRDDAYEITISEFTGVGRSVLQVIADDADNVSTKAKKNVIL